MVYSEDKGYGDNLIHKSASFSNLSSVSATVKPYP